MPAVLVPEVDHWLILVGLVGVGGGGGGVKRSRLSSVQTVFSLSSVVAFQQSWQSCKWSRLIFYFPFFIIKAILLFFFAIGFKKPMSQLFKTIFKNKSVFESQIKIELIIHQMWKTSSEITSQYLLILFHCQKWSPKSSRLQPLRPACPLRKQVLRAKKIVNFRYKKWNHFVEGFFSTNLDLLTSRAFERVARQWARSEIVRARSASERKLVVRAGSYHTRPENQANDFEKVYD